MGQKVKKQITSMRFCLVCEAMRKFMLVKEEMHSYCSVCQNHPAKRKYIDPKKWKGKMKLKKLQRQHKINY